MEPQLPTTASNRRLRATVNPTLLRGERVWLVSWFVGGKRKRRFFDSRAVAETEARMIEAAQADHASAWAAMPASERDEVLRIVAATKARGVSLGKVWAEWSSSTDRPRVDRTLGDAYTDLLAAKKAAGRSVAYLNNLKHLVGGFVRGREKIPVAAVTVELIDEHLKSRPLRSHPTIVTRLSTLFEFAIRREWMASNPAKRVEAVRLDRIAPAVFTPRQLARALVWLRRNRPRSLGWFVLSALCGLRPEEAEKTSWDAVSLEGEVFVRVEAQTSKIRQRRVVYPLPAAAAWLKVAKDAGAALPLPHQERRYACRELAKYLKLGAWPKDITRHTAASYWLAAARNAAEVAGQLGNSPGILKAHYDALVTREAAARVWSLIPRTRRELSGNSGRSALRGGRRATGSGDEKAAAR